MKILLVSEFFPTGKDLRFSGGVEARTFFLAKHLAKRHKITIICTKLKGSKVKETMFGFTVCRIGPERRYEATVSDIINRLRFIKEAVKFGQTLDIDIVDGGNFIAHFITKSIAQGKKVSCVGWYPDVWIGSWIKNTGVWGIFGEILERINLFRGFDFYIPISKVVAKKLKKRVAAKLKVIPCGIDWQEFKSSEKKFKEPTIVCISRLAKYKNLRTLIFAFAHLSVKIKNARLIIIGSGPEHSSLESLAKALKISPKVKFLSNLPRKQLISLIKSSHIFTSPSLVEGFGIATIESAACGLPYVISDIAVHREITRGGQGGFLLDPYDALSFSDRLFNLLKNETLYKEKSRQAQALTKNYNWEQISTETESIYFKCISDTLI